MAEKPTNLKRPRRQIKSIVKRSGLLSVDKIAEMFCLKKETLLKKWNDGAPIISELELKRLGKFYVADEIHVWKILDRYKNSLPLAVPKWRKQLQK